MILVLDFRTVLHFILACRNNLQHHLMANSLLGVVAVGLLQMHSKIVSHVTCDNLTFH